MLRILGLFFIGMGLTAAALDFYGRGEGGFAFSPIGKFWFDIHKTSLIGLQSGLENRVSPELWETIAPVLDLPAAPVLFGIGVAVLVLKALLKIRAANKRAERI